MSCENIANALGKLRDTLPPGSESYDNAELHMEILQSACNTRGTHTARLLNPNREAIEHYAPKAQEFLQKNGVEPPLLKNQ